MFTIQSFDYQRYKWLAAWQSFYASYYLFGREADLQRLMAWAQRKRLTKPRHAYLNRLIETQTTLTRVHIHSPQIWHFARVCFQIMDRLFPPPKYLRRGSA